MQRWAAPLVMDRVAAADPFLREHPPTLEFYGSNCDSAILELDHPFSLTVIDVLRGLNPGYRVWAQTPGNDLRHFIVHGVPCVMVGPGDDPLSHTANESADVELIVQAAKFYAHLALEWCG